jgi:hypothetical protein
VHVGNHAESDQHAGRGLGDDRGGRDWNSQNGQRGNGQDVSSRGHRMLSSSGVLILRQQAGGGDELAESKKRINRELK